MVITCIILLNDVCYLVNSKMCSC